MSQLEIVIDHPASKRSRAGASPDINHEHGKIAQNINVAEERIEVNGV